MYVIEDGSVKPKALVINKSKYSAGRCSSRLTQPKSDSGPAWPHEESIPGKNAAVSNAMPTSDQRRSIPKMNWFFVSLHLSGLTTHLSICRAMRECASFLLMPLDHLRLVSVKFTIRMSAIIDTVINMISRLYERGK